MKLVDVIIGGTVYLKKSTCLSHYNLTHFDYDTPLTVLAVVKVKGRIKRVQVNAIEKPVCSSRLTDTPCSQMDCYNCKYHTHE